MPRYSISVTVRLDADDEDAAFERASEAIAVGCDQAKKRFGFLDYSVDDVEDEDEGSNGDMTT